MATFGHCEDLSPRVEIELVGEARVLCAWKRLNEKCCEPCLLGFPPLPFIVKVVVKCRWQLSDTAKIYLFAWKLSWWEKHVFYALGKRLNEKCCEPCLQG
ncbi:hypothetical protein CEXT_95281 [Caerostris extrusa]|uniref:Uncharacterized protein n=1 Tax=Caerostris extrusa TaxID=172846 RepID=A0AAV4VUX0_CAEEX|nr:hypothetical protein CEXT_95281 [Caerostris extrusa]